MMVDVDKLKEALELMALTDGRVLQVSEIPSRAEIDEAAHMIAAAARMVVAGQPIWWCEEHETQRDDDFPEEQCWRKSTQEDGPEQLPCRMVEGWWSPTGKDET